ncbi:Rieske 2Fe-2S domain-containing protein [Janibacter cremeus]|uniref:Rieske 2Fe-2S domain-containing protein n=1 Tax=Janibacter cremeus TaxID=1285192 RepID=UPI0023F73736|nr:Rieske 2Fe-2S domain-containing protein [Janibacter cremeus]WEV78902.1 Rieske 2Fe-2S domain-containing protein [Janibacter cremeus]
MTALGPLTTLTDRIERLARLDEPGKAVGTAIRKAVPAGGVKDALSGTWLGHPVHPPLTDVVIGSFVGASVLDLVGPDDGRASRRLLQLGLLTAVPTALSGASDWADSELGDEGVRRMGLVHAGANVVALSLYALSLAARRGGPSRAGSALALAGSAVLGVSGFLGGHITFVRGTGVNQTAFDVGPSDWTDVVDAGEVPQEGTVAAMAGETPVVLGRHRGQVFALHDRCSHRGCALSDGEVEEQVITCPCHGSRFDVRDGSVVRGPATATQPVLDARETDGRIEVRVRRASR